MLDTGSWLIVALACIVNLALRLYVKHQENADLRGEVTKFKGQLAVRETELVVSQQKVERLDKELTFHRKMRKYGLGGGGVGGYSSGGNTSMISPPAPPSTTISFDYGILDPEVVAKLFGEKEDRTIEELRNEAQEAVEGLAGELEEEVSNP